MLSAEEQKIRTDLYNQGLNDRQIAERVYVCKEAIAAWRRRTELPPHNRRKPSSKVDRDRVKDLLDQGMSLSSIAKELGCAKSSVSYWKNRKANRRVENGGADMRGDTDGDQ